MTGAALVTVALMLAVYGVVGGNEAGWTSTRTLSILALAVGLLVAFVIRESRVENPLVPLRLFTLRNVVISQVVGVLWAGAMFACFFLSALYLQGVLGYDALQVGLAYLPSCVVMAVMSLGISDKLVMRYGVRPPLVAGLALVAASLALFAIAPVDGTYVVHVLPPMVLLGLGAGIAFNPVLLAAMGDVEPHEAGLASGVVNTSFMMGGALGLAVLVAISSSRTSSLVASGSSMPEALTGGYQVAFAAGAVMAALAAVIGGVFLRPQPMGVGADAHGASVDPSRSPSPRPAPPEPAIRGSPVQIGRSDRFDHRRNARDYPDFGRRTPPSRAELEAEGLVEAAGGGAVVLDGEVDSWWWGGDRRGPADGDDQVPAGAAAAGGVGDGEVVEVAVAVGLHPPGGVPEEPRPLLGEEHVELAVGLVGQEAFEPGVRRGELLVVHRTDGLPVGVRWPAGSSAPGRASPTAAAAEAEYTWLTSLAGQPSSSPSAAIRTFATSPAISTRRSRPAAGRARRRPAASPSGPRRRRRPRPTARRARRDRSPRPSRRGRPRRSGRPRGRPGPWTPRPARGRRARGDSVALVAEHRGAAAAVGLLGRDQVEDLVEVVGLHRVMVIVMLPAPSAGRRRTGCPARRPRRPSARTRRAGSR